MFSLSTDRCIGKQTAVPRDAVVQVGRELDVSPPDAGRRAWLFAFEAVESRIGWRKVVWLCVSLLASSMTIYLETGCYRYGWKATEPLMLCCFWIYDWWDLYKTLQKYLLQKCSPQVKKLRIAVTICSRSFWSVTATLERPASSTASGLESSVRANTTPSAWTSPFAP